MVIAADYPLLDIFWTMIIFFLWVAWFWVLIGIISDVFSRDDLSGWGKASWTFLILFLPFLGVLIYLISHGDDMGQRRMDRMRAAQAQTDEYVRSVAGAGGPAAEIEKAKGLLDSGAITQQEFDAIKAKAIA